MSVVVLPSLVLLGASLLGFDLEPSSVPAAAIVRGGPPKDGIPALLAPTFVAATDAAFLAGNDRVIGVEIAGEARAYPIRILNWHEVVNDRVANVPLAVTWCPLTASALVFDRRRDDGELSFGVSGLLYQSNVLVYDHQTESLWSQLAARSVAGPRTGARLSTLPATETTWDAWRRQHPKTRVLSTSTGHRRDYRRDPYADYHRSAAFIFETSPADVRLRVKDKVLGVVVGDAAAAFPHADLHRAHEARFEIAGTPLRVRYDRASAAARVERSDTGATVPSTWVYWFAWSAVHPGVALWRAPDAAARAAPSDAIRGVAVPSDEVEVPEHGAYWTDLPGIEPAPNHGGLLVIRGTLHNRGAAPVHHVRLVYELLDSDGELVTEAVGFNRGAEELTPLDAPEDVGMGPAKVHLIAADGHDSFRMLLPAGDLPAIRTYRVRVADVVVEERSSGRPR